MITYDSAIAKLLPTSYEQEHKGKKLLFIPHRPVETRILYQRGYDVSSPLTAYYDWGNTTPYDHQKTTSNLLVFSKRAYVLNDMGTGKTLSVLYAIDFLKKLGLINKVLVVAPLSTLTSVWQRETFRWMPHLDTVVLYGTRQQRLKSLGEESDLYIINHDGINVIKDELKEMDFDVYVLDELTAFKNQSTNRWKNMKSIMSYDATVWGLTGRPIPQGPTDAYGQIKLLTPERVPRSFRMFRAKTMTQVSTFTWIPKKDATQTVFKAMQPAVRFTMDECVSLPPIVYSHIEVAMNKKQQNVYSEIFHNLYYEWQNDEVTVANEGVKLLKLLQVCCGFLYAENQKVIPLDHSIRFDTLVDLLTASRNKVIVFAPFKYTVKSLYKQLNAHGFSCEMIYGETSKQKRDTIFNAFQHEDEPRVLVAHPKTMSHGLTLTAANVVIWYAPPPSLEIYEQANARVRRPSQQQKQYIIHLASKGVENKLYKRLKNKQSLQGSLLELFEESQSSEYN